MLTSTAVLAAAVLHASWNAVAKGTHDRMGLFVRMQLAGLVVSVLLFACVRPPAVAAVPWLIASAVVHVGYSLALLASYRVGDFNLAYPLARGTAPLLVTLVAVGIGQRLSTTAAVGLVVISAALCVLGLTPWLAGRFDRPAVAAALVTGVAIAGYTLIDGFGVRRSQSAAGYTLAMSAIQTALTLLLALSPAVRRRLGAHDRESGHPIWVRSVSAALMSLSAYGLVLWAQTRGNLAAVAALRETSTVVAALIGWAVFRESMSRTRVAASVAIALGAALLAVAGVD